MPVYLQVERGQVAVNGLPLSPRRPVPLRDHDTLALFPASACLILLGCEVPVWSDFLVVLGEAKPSKRPRSRLVVGEVVARFSTVRSRHSRREQALLESYFPENCSLRRLCERVMGSPASELQTPEGAVLFTTQVRETEPLRKR